MAKYPWPEKDFCMEKQFEIIEEAIKERLRQINDTKELKHYFVDGANNITSKHNIYKMINTQGEVIYIGRTGDHGNRVEGQHLYNAGHLSSECYEELEEIHIAPVNNKDEANIYERYLINLLSPKYNNKMKNNSEFRFKLPELTWYKYEDYLKVF